MKITKALDITQESDGWIVASTPAVDRDRDRIMPMGGDLTNFNKNPVLIFGHNYHEPWAVIGRVAQTSIDSTGIRMLPELRQPANESDPMHIIRALWEQGLLRAGSIGFIPLESRDNEFGGKDFTKWELLELSLTPIPANQDAIRLAVKAFDEEIKEPHTEEHTDEVAPAPIPDPDELTPQQQANLMEALAQLTNELTTLLTGEQP
jgi:HK97 family phage prohead protease